MKWSRDDDESGEGGVVLRFPTGLQMKLELPKPEPETDGEDPQPETHTLGSPAYQRAQRRTETACAVDASTARALVAWNMVGLSLFASGRRPTRQEVTDEAEHVLLAQTMERYRGNITYMAVELKMSRRSVRTRLRKYGMYDRSRMDEGNEDELADEDDPADGDEPEEHRRGHRAQGEEAQADAR